MNKHRLIRQILFSIMIAYSIYAVYFFIIDFTATSQLKAVEGGTEFPITNLFKVSEGRITAHSITYNKNEFIEYDCCIDSLYLIHIVKIGKTDSNIFLNNAINLFSKEDSPLRESSFYCVCIPPVLSPIYINFLSFYDVRLLPNIDIEKINVYLDGELIGKDTITNNVLSYSVNVFSISYAFNHSKREDMISVGNSFNPIRSKLIFYQMPTGVSYIINISTNDGSEVDIANIFNL